MELPCFGLCSYVEKMGIDVSLTLIKLYKFKIMIIKTTKLI